MKSFTRIFFLALVGMALVLPVQAGSFATGGSPDISAPVITVAPHVHTVDGLPTITWMTSKLADSRVRYGLDPSSLIHVAGDIDYTQNHEVKLPPLRVGVTYYYQVTSVDPAGNTVTGDVNSFSPDPATYLLTVLRVGAGTGSVTGGGLDCGQSCTASFVNEMSVTLVASAGTGSIFTGWSGEECSGTGACTVAMSQARSVIASFTVASHMVTPSADTGGSIMPGTPQAVAHGADLSFVLTPAPGYQLTAVTGCGGSLNGTTYSTGPVSADCTVLASFTPEPVDEPQPGPEPTPTADPEPVYDDGSTVCYVYCSATVYENGIRRVESLGLDADGVSGDTGYTIDLRTTTTPTDPQAGILHELTVLDALGDELYTTLATSDVPGATTIINLDEQGRPRIITQSGLADGTHMEVTAQADGAAIHQVSPPGGLATRAVIMIPGAVTQIKVDGTVETVVDTIGADGNALRVVVETYADGSGMSRFNRHDPLTGIWSTETTLNSINQFEPGHDVLVQEQNGKVQIRVTSNISRDIYF